MAHDSVGRADLEIVADLADRRPVAAAADFLADKVVDLALTLGKLV
jgi:hypothetical protein